MSSKEVDKYEKLRQKHGAALLKVQANKEKLRQQGTVKSWMEVLVLLNDQNPNHVRPVQKPAVDPNKRVDPRIAAGIIPPPKGLQASAAPSPKTPQQQQRAPQQQAAQQAPPSAPPVAREQPPKESVLAPKKGLSAYEQLPTPQNPKLVLANDRKIYDNALEQQLMVEQQKLQDLMANKNATAAQIQRQKDQVEQLVQQKELVVRQQKQAQDTRTQQIKEAQARAAKAKAVEQAKLVTVPPEKLEGAELEATLKDFFHAHEPEALEDGRLEAVLIWTEERGVEKLCAMLREQYGKDLYGKTNAENTATDQVQADRYARRLMGFYKAHGVKEMQNWEECLKLGEWACKAGEAALNSRLQAKYNDDLDSYGQSVMLSVEGKLREFYMRKNPDVIEKGLGPLLTWVVSNGVDALNDMLRDKYGEDLNGQRPEFEEKADRGKSARAIFRRELLRDDSLSKIPVEDAVAKRKEVLIKQLASFLEVNDPKRLQTGGLVPLVQWALPRTDKQVDDLLMESYGADLDEAGLRRLSFDDDEVKSIGDNVNDGVTATAVRAASSQMEDEFARAEIRSVRATTDERPLSKAVSEDGYAGGEYEPDF